jgi:purine catabolism regulator
LFEYLLSNGNQAEAAKRLFIHPNTLRYRLAKISDMLGVNLDDAAVRATLWAGVMIGKFGQDRKTARKLPLS